MLSLLQKSRRKIDLVSGDKLLTELNENVLAVDCAEQLVCGPVVQLFSCVGIDVAHHKVNISLGKMVKGSSFGKNTSDHLMCDLAGAFLVGALGIAEEDAGAKLAGGHVALDGEWIGKFAAPVGQDDREERLKHLSAQDRIEGIENLRDRSGGVVIPEEGKHELTIGEEDRKENLPAFASFYRIHLDNGSVRIGTHVFEVILVGSPQMALFVHANSFLLFAYAVTNLAWQIEVAHGEKTCLDVIVDRLLVQHDHVGVACADVVNGLPLPDQRRDDVVDAAQLFRRDCDSLAAFAARGFVFFLCSLGVIQMTAKWADVPFFAAVTDIRRFPVLRAEFLLEVFTDLVAGDTAFSAILRPFVVTGRTDIPTVLAGASVKAGIAAASAVLDDEMVSHFLGDRRRIFSETRSDL